MRIGACLPLLDGVLAGDLTDQNAGQNRQTTLFYGNFAIKLLRLQNEMIQIFDRYRRGNKQTVEVPHVHIHSGAQGVVGIINPPDDRDAAVRE
jgi:hypothetical protein